MTAPFYSGTNTWGGRRLSSSDGGGANVGVNVNVPGSSSGGGSGSSSSGNNNKNNQQGQGQSQQQQQQGQTGVNVKAPFTDVAVDAGKSGRCARLRTAEGISRTGRESSPSYQVCFLLPKNIPHHTVISMTWRGVACWDCLKC